ncbi:hypothetical protein [Cupriavidus plantarum]|uniref:hypothetical protein n=1 Tax=Cupriavidus plantarum TaxID=942865 RepID=UPI0015E811D7|nr:hypothetical protein [Cupriavidus plantarum]
MLVTIRRPHHIAPFARELARIYPDQADGLQHEITEDTGPTHAEYDVYGARVDTGGARQRPADLALRDQRSACLRDRTGCAHGVALGAVSNARTKSSAAAAERIILRRCERGMAALTLSRERYVRIRT